MVIFPIKITGSVKVKCSLKKFPKHTVLICNYFQLHLSITSYIHSTGPGGVSAKMDISCGPVSRSSQEVRETKFPNRLKRGIFRKHKKE